MRVMAAMSGGVDSSVAAARLVAAGHEVVGVTLRLWGGPSDQGCCSVSDVEDARRAAQQLGIDHWVFNFADDFEDAVVAPYVADHAAGRTPNPCVECNRRVKFDRLLERATSLGFEAVATGHHARVDRCRGRYRLRRGADPRKDQSYVLHVLGQAELARVLFPVGAITKDQVRAEAEALGLRTAAKPDSQDVCFVTSTEGRRGFLGERLALHPGVVVDADGREVGHVDAVELVTVGQRRGLGAGGSTARRYAVEVDVPSRRVVVGTPDELTADELGVERLSWVGPPRFGPVEVQTSAHGTPAAADLGPAGTGTGGVVRWHRPHRRVAPGQSVVFYDGDEVLGGALAAP